MVKKNAAFILYGIFFFFFFCYSKTITITLVDIFYVRLQHGATVSAPMATDTMMSQFYQFYANRLWRHKTTDRNDWLRTTLQQAWSYFLHYLCTNVLHLADIFICSDSQKYPFINEYNEYRFTRSCTRNAISLKKKKKTCWDEIQEE